MRIMLEMLVLEIGVYPACVLSLLCSHFEAIKDDSLPPQVLRLSAFSPKPQFQTLSSTRWPFTLFSF